MLRILKIHLPVYAQPVSARTSSISENPADSTSPPDLPSIGKLSMIAEMNAQMSESLPAESLAERRQRNERP
jgi:hypothetical protein